MFETSGTCLLSWCMYHKVWFVFLFVCSFVCFQMTLSMSLLTFKIEHNSERWTRRILHSLGMHMLWFLSRSHLSSSCRYQVQGPASFNLCLCWQGLLPSVLSINMDHSPCYIVFPNFDPLTLSISILVPGPLLGRPKAPTWCVSSHSSNTEHCVIFSHTFGSHVN